jgi:hypothetical protein
VSNGEMIDELMNWKESGRKWSRPNRITVLTVYWMD